MSSSKQIANSILRVGEVVEVIGRKILVRVTKNKNLTDLFFDGEFVRNVSVNSYVEIRKGFVTLIGKVEGERIEEERIDESISRSNLDRNLRTLTISLVGFIDKDGVFFGGTRELPLIGNEAFLVTGKRIHQIHNLVRDNGASVSFARTEAEDYRIEFPVDGLFNSHIAIFGNTGSGKSNTLAAMFGSFVRTMEIRNENEFRTRCKFLLFDFNGEYAHEKCITPNKKVYNLSTKQGGGDRIPVSQESLLDNEIIAILADATEKTQKPFLKRAVSTYKYVFREGAQDSEEHFRNLLRQRVTQILQMSDKIRADLLFDYLRDILPAVNAAGEIEDLSEDLDWHNYSAEFKWRTNGAFLKTNPQNIPQTIVYNRIAQFAFDKDLLSRLIVFMYLQLISDVLTNRAQNEHIAPAINKLKSKRSDIEKVLDTTGAAEFWSKNFVVVNLNGVNLEMKKTIPLLISKREYQLHKDQGVGYSLCIIVDEAHNILSTASTREAESWKDYRLETFEEIIKEGRKFGVFVTIASQRPNDISPTITSQAHNYFIHRLINQKDLATIASAVSYIDQLSEESIPALPTGTCIFSGTAGQMPIKICVDKLADEERPKSGTLDFSETVPLQN